MLAARLHRSSVLELAAHKEAVDLAAHCRDDVAAVLLDAVGRPIPRHRVKLARDHPLGACKRVLTALQ